MTSHKLLTVNNSNLISFFLILLVFFGCNNASEKKETVIPEEIIHLDNITALKNKKQLYLSEIVDSIEYIKLETNVNCLLPRSYMLLGREYMIFYSHEPAQVLLFSRQGKFIRSIGSQGKGPGEYLRPNQVDLSPNEDKIIVIDDYNNVAIEYNINGKHLQTYKPKASLSHNLYYLDQSTLVYLQSYPFMDSLNFPQVIALNLNNLDEEVLHYQDFKFSTSTYYELNYSPYFFPNNNGFLFRYSLCDTMYQINPDLSMHPKVIVDVGENIPPAYRARDLNYDHVGYIFDLPNHLLMIGNYKERFHQVFNKKTGELFTLPKIDECRRKITYPYGIINDIDGLSSYWPFTGMDIYNNSYAIKNSIIYLKEYIETKCFKEAELVTPQYRERLMELLEQSDINDNPIIRILHLKR